ncbi:MAG: hypothetical protein WHT26_06185 [Thermus sp.]|uniref:hypothetical protein n=1 Tax=Thermus sp. TaxID=275 RepID=UPI0030A6C8DD
MRTLALLPILLSLAMAMTPAGTVIRNQAQGWVGGEVYLSNPVETVVQALCVPLLSPSGTQAAPGQRATVLPGGFSYLVYRLQNAGNDPFTFNLNVALAGDFAPAGVRLVLDRNGNGLPDPGEGEVASVTLAPGEGAGLVLEVQAPPDASGTLLLSPVATCPGGEDRENWAAVEVAQAALSLLKSVVPGRVLPGEEATFSLEVRNLSPVTVPVRVEDPLGGLSGLAYVPGSASATRGTVEYYDGAAWRPTEPPTVSGLALVADLPPGGSARLTFRVRALADAPPGVRTNRATARGGGAQAEGEAPVEVLPLPRHHLGPGGNPKALPGGEGSPDDEQRARTLQGQPSCFPHTLLNEGTVEDRYRIEAILPPGVSLALGRNGLPLDQPILLRPGEALDFEACVLAQDAGTFKVELVARSLGSGTLNRTWDILEAVPADALSLTKEATPPPGTTLKPGDEITYTLRIQNRYAPLTGAVVEDPLPEGVEFLEAPGGTYDPATHTVRFLLDPLPLGETVLTVRVRVKNVPDDTLLLNRFTLRSRETPNPLPSNPVEHPVFGVNLLLRKGVAPEVARLGEVLTYRLEVVNPSQAPLTVRLVDTPDPALRYLPGSARIQADCQGEGVALEPREEGGSFVWEGLSLRGGGRLCVVYKMRVERVSRAELRNIAQAFGLSAQGAAVASAQVQALVRALQPLEEKALLVGRVYLDLDEDGRYTPGRDLPLKGARLLLANGWQALTDEGGRYAFRDLRPGPYQVMLDPASAPFPPLPHLEALGEGYRRGVQVFGLTQADFPLKAPKGTVKVERSTELRFGPLYLEKRLVQVGNEAWVHILLKAQTPLPEFSLRDGEEVFSVEVLEGERELTLPYRGEFTDPEVRWRYP